MMRHGLLLSLLAVSRFATAQSAPPTIDQSLSMTSVGAPVISPDGTHILFERNHTDWDDNSFAIELWMTTPNGGAPRRFTAPVKSASGAKFSPDSKWVAFLSDRPGVLAKSPAGKQQLYVVPVDGGEAVQLTRFETGVNAYEWAPDGKSIIFSAANPDSEFMKDRKETFGDYHVIHSDYAMVHLWQIPLGADPAAKVATPVRLTEGAYSVGDFKVSPDGAMVAFAAQRDPDLISGFSSDIYTVTLAGHAVKKVVDTKGPDTHPIFSPDSKQIVFITSNGDPHFFYSNQKIAVVPADGSAKPVVLNEAFDEDATLVAWTPAGIYFSALQRTASRLFVLDPATKSIKAVSPDGQLLNAASVTPDGKAAAWRGAKPNEMAEIYASSLAGFAPKKLTDEGAQLAKFPHTTREVVTWKSGDGSSVEGILEKPADYQAGKKYPLLVIIHGGPTGIDTPYDVADRTYPAERFMARGALILRPNYRGSAGYGAKFRALNYRNLGVGDYADVISGVDALIAKGLVDPDKVGAMGWSEGGYISAFITCSSNRFKAVSVGAGISDWATYYYNTDITPFTRQYLEATPVSDPEIYKKTSPITYVAAAQTPTLIQQGSADKRVPVADSFELRQALEDKGIPVKMVLYDGFGHPINKPKQQRAAMMENELWFDHYIWGDPLPADLTPVKKAAEAK